MDAPKELPSAAEMPDDQGLAASIGIYDETAVDVGGADQRTNNGPGQKNSVLRQTSAPRYFCFKSNDGALLSSRV